MDNFLAALSQYQTLSEIPLEYFVYADKQGTLKFMSMENLDDPELVKYRIDKDIYMNCPLESLEINAGIIKKKPPSLKQHVIFKLVDDHQHADFFTIKNHMLLIFNTYKKDCDCYKETYEN